MNKEMLVAAAADKTDLTKRDVEAVLNALMETSKEALANGDNVRLAGFGTFDVVKRSARKGVHPRTGEAIKIKACKAVRFRASKAVKTAVNTTRKKKKIG